MLIISMTTLPTRIAYMDPVLDALLGQTVLPDKIVIYIPKKCKRLASYQYIISQSMMAKQEMYPELLKIREVEEDLGPVTKIIPALREYTNESDIIISVDDDVIPEKHFVEEFLSAHEEMPGAVLGYMGTHTSTNKFFHCELIQGNEKNHRLYREITDGVLGGYRGILYPRKLISDTVFSYLDDIIGLHDSLPYPMLDDDLFMSLALEKLGVPKYVIGTFYPGDMKSTKIHDKINIKQILNTDGVSSPTNREKIAKSRDIIKRYFRQNQSGI